MQLLIAERDENTCRKDFTLSEAVSIADDLLGVEREAATQRQQRGKSEDGSAGGRGKKKNLPQNLGKVKKPHDGEAKRAAAAATGYSAITLDKARKVKAAAEAEPEKFAELKEEMDRTGNADRAFPRDRRDDAASAAKYQPPRDKNMKDSTEITELDDAPGCGPGGPAQGIKQQVREVVREELQAALDKMDDEIAACLRALSDRLERVEKAIDLTAETMRRMSHIISLGQGGRR